MNYFDQIYETVKKIEEKAELDSSDTYESHSDQVFKTNIFYTDGYMIKTEETISEKTQKCLALNASIVKTKYEDPEIDFSEPSWFMDEEEIEYYISIKLQDNNYFNISVMKPGRKPVAVIQSTDKENEARFISSEALKEAKKVRDSFNPEIHDFRTYNKEYEYPIYDSCPTYPLEDVLKSLEALDYEALSTGNFTSQRTK